jgi:signal transduction histidine kinase
VDLEVRVDGRLPEPVEVSAYYIVAEALTNAAKHARASTVGVEAEVVGDLLRVTVRDDVPAAPTWPGAPAWPA